MENSKQSDTIKKALALEVSIDNNEKTLSSLLSEQFQPAPVPPTRTLIERKYPEVTSQLKFKWAIAFAPLVAGLILPNIHFLWLDVLGVKLLSVSIAWIPIYYFIIKKMRKKNIEQIIDSAEYKNMCYNDDKRFDRMQEEADTIYNRKKTEYENEILPLYQNALNKWSEHQNKRIDEVKNNLKIAQEELKSLYETTKIIPLQYREIEALQYIYDIVSTSDYDVKYAIDMYDRNEQRKIDEAKLYEQQQANMLADEQNMLLNQQNEISAKARRDANIAAVVGTVQHHNTNKYLKPKKK